MDQSQREAARDADRRAFILAERIRSALRAIIPPEVDIAFTFRQTERKITIKVEPKPFVFESPYLGGGGA